MFFPVIVGRRRYHTFRSNVTQVITSESDRNNLHKQDIIFPLLQYFDSIYANRDGYLHLSKCSSDFDFHDYAYRYLYTACHSLLISGSYHIYRGELSPVGESLFSLFPHVLDYYIHAGLLPESERQKQINILLDNISCVG